ncbi:type VI secretion system baseplate subunit TssK [Massilia sp. Se16.2.3]|uniref:type VI secretion system baseplate subunit TssK n=1 Tax=Massilia sp. Se16.2.3 TaxID=2709303 RepID=UPI0018610D8F|nr:type VI secretion system baseplate subunit TssK [Massilia sp. Se16.2.3]QNA99656.1 type VI secretion system baseplate subunit TssK [Massilia sp. Se16.2.3]
MNMPSKLLWGEGLFLRPQHFQQQDRYHEARLNQTARALHPYAWGVRRLVVDHEALKHDVLRIDALSLLFPDGELYRAPEGDALPSQVKLGALAPSTQTITFHAALPALKAHGENCAEPDLHRMDARFVQHERDTQDLFTAAADAPLTYLKKTLRLVSDEDALDAYESFPLLRLRRVATGGFEVDPAFIAPSVAIDGAPGLHNLVARLMEKLLAKVNALYGHMREPSRKVVEIRGGDMSSFWLLHTASTGYAALSHYLHHPELHPERLFSDMLALAGGLMAYSRNYRLEDLPAYAHADPGPAFARLADILRDLLDTVVSSRYFSIALRNDRPSYHVGALDSGKITGQTALYLAVSADMPALQLVEVVPLRFKLGAPQDVDKFVLSALPGVKLMYAPQVPAALPVRPDTCYFALENKGLLYENMLKVQAISIYVPNGIRDLQLDLIGVAA